ncbi:mucin-19-like, partial [Rhincodon typus]|uniref:mucin-19-like n=1 Tax=Rhincodon typus TaxID=259920 RepID=UPI00202E98A2
MKYSIFLILWAFSLLKDDVFSHQRIKRDYSMNNYELDGSAVTQNFRYARDVSSKSYEGPRTCRTWGQGAIRTYTDDFYHMASTCNYILTRQCKGNMEDFNVEIRRGSNGNLEHIFMKIEGAMIVVANGTIMVKGTVISLPYFDKVINIQHRGISVSFSNRKHTIILTWNYQDALQVTVDGQYHGQLCGLCGTFDESVSATSELDFIQYKLDSSDSSCTTTFPKETNCASAKVCSEMPKIFPSCSNKAMEDKYIEICQKDICACKGVAQCNCANFAEMSHQCVNSEYSVWKKWRKVMGCALPTCPGNQIYMECGPVCKSTCTDPNPQQQCDQCVNTCGCPEGTVLDNIRGDDKCISQMECPCEYGGTAYESGRIRTTFGQSCICQRGMWECADLNSPEICKTEEGTHITTFDGRYYNLIGDCSYYAIVTKYWSVKIEMHPCQVAYKQTCLQRVTYTKYQDSYIFNNDGTVDYNGNSVGVPLVNGDIKIFHQSSKFLQVSTESGLKMQIQIHPIMQLYISLPKTAKGTTKGLCGTFNHNAEDDFLSAQGIVEYTYVAFANSWREGDNCPPPQVNPTCVSSEDEIYAKRNCAYLKDPKGAFAKCHSAVEFAKYFEMCKVASCHCERVDDCICAALEAYSHACAAKGIIVNNWRRSICSVTCPSTQVFQYGMTACNRTCRFLSRPDITCEVQDVPVDGCGCPEGVYMNEKGACVSRSECPCYFGGLIVQKDQPINVDGAQCFCVNGIPSCPGEKGPFVPKECGEKEFSNCQNPDICRKTCQTLNRLCPKACVPGCVCPGGLVEDYNGNCILPEKCPCSYGGEIFNSGETIKSDCNDCTCKGGLWTCTNKPCPKTCLVYGDGHYITFDGRRYSYDGNCEYTIVEDQCQRAIGTFQILTESVPCCENGVTCSRNIRILFEDRELILLSGNGVTEVSLGKTQCTDNLYTLHTVGLYLVLTFSNGITVIWDKRTRLSITLDATWKNKVCGLCGNFNDDIEDDLTTKWNYVVTSPVEFGNSWKTSQSCSNTVNQTFPCDRNPYCLSWAQKRCNIIKGAVFQACHKKVDPTPYYDACVEEACACDMEGRYLGFCTAVAVYAEACNKVDVCIHWRTPDLCPVYCDYYNAPGECSWHYHPCGTWRTKTCSDHSIAKKLSANLEGCYAKCPVSAPYLDENTMKCVTLPQCTCYYDGRILQPGEITWNDCEKCTCTNGVTQCEQESTTSTGTSTTTETTASSTTETTTTTVPTTTTFSTTASTAEQTTTTTEITTTASST